MDVLRLELGRMRGGCLWGVLGIILGLSENMLVCFDKKAVYDYVGPGGCELVQ